MRISDWSSDVCSSDLKVAECGGGEKQADEEDRGNHHGPVEIIGAAKKHHRADKARKIKECAQPRRSAPGGPAKKGKRHQQWRYGNGREVEHGGLLHRRDDEAPADRKSTRLNTSH